MVDKSIKKRKALTCWMSVDDNVHMGGSHKTYQEHVIFMTFQLSLFYPDLKCFSVENSENHN